MSARRFVRSCSIVSVMKAFLPGSTSIGSLKSPSLNFLTTAIAIFFTAMWLATRLLTSSAMEAISPRNLLRSMTTSMSPRACSDAICRICSRICTKLFWMVASAAIVRPASPGSDAENDVEKSPPAMRSAIAARSVSCCASALRPRGTASSFREVG